MGLEQLRTFGLWTALALAAAAVCLPWFRLRARRQRRHAVWRELCLRLELIPDPGDRQVATGQLKGVSFSLRDTGSRWLLEVPLSQPLLPAGVTLLPASERSLLSLFRLRPLKLKPFSAASPLLGWYAGRDMPPSKAEVSPAFHSEAAHAAEAHAPLRVEPHRLIHTLRQDGQLSVEDIRGAVRTLDVTAQRWLHAVGSHGLPRVEALPPHRSAFQLLCDVLERYPLWPFLRCR